METLDTIKSKLIEITSSKYSVFFDVETSGFDPFRNCVIALGCTVKNNHTGDEFDFYEECRPDTLTQNYEHPSMKGFIVETWSPHAEKVHGISWKRATSAQHPSDLCIKLLKFLAPFVKNNEGKKLPFCYYANAYFDWKMIKCLFYKNSDRAYFAFLRAFKFEQSYDILSMVKTYSKQFSDQLDIIKENEKKFAKPRKKPVAKRYAEKWQLEIDNAKARLKELGGLKEFNSNDLGSVCKALGIKHDHHHAMSDTKALPKLIEFLIGELAPELT